MMIYIISVILISLMQLPAVRNYLHQKGICNNSIVVLCRIVSSLCMVIILQHGFSHGMLTIEKLRPDFSFNWSLICLIGCMIIALMNYLHLNSNLGLLSQFPQLQLSYGLVPYTLINALTWSTYLIAYELVWRVLLFNLLYIRLGTLAVAATVNALFNGLLHLFKSKSEALGSVAFSSVACIVTYYSGSAWPAIIMHLFFAFHFDMLALRYKLKSGIIIKPAQL